MSEQFKSADDQLFQDDAAEQVPLPRDRTSPTTQTAASQLFQDDQPAADYRVAQKLKDQPLQFVKDDDGNDLIPTYEYHTKPVILDHDNKQLIVDGEDAQQGLMSGKYSPGSSFHYIVVDPSDQKRRVVDGGSLLPALDKGFRIETEEQAQVRRGKQLSLEIQNSNDEFLNSKLAQGLTYADQFVDQLSFGALDAYQRHGDDNTTITHGDGSPPTSEPNRLGLQAMKDANPRSSLAGNVAGFATSMLTGGGGIEATALNATRNLVDRGAVSATSKLAQNVTRGLIEGGLIAAPATITEEALGDHEEAAENLLFSGLLGGMIPLVGAGLRGLEKKAVNVAAKSLGFDVSEIVKSQLDPKITTQFIDGELKNVGDRPWQVGDNYTVLTDEGIDKKVIKSKADIIDAVESTREFNATARINKLQNVQAIKGLSNDIKRIDRELNSLPSNETFGDKQLDIGEGKQGFGTWLKKTGLVKETGETYKDVAQRAELARADFRNNMEFSTKKFDDDIASKISEPARETVPDVGSPLSTGVGVASTELPPSLKPESNLPDNKPELLRKHEPDSSWKQKQADDVAARVERFKKQRMGLNLESDPPLGDKSEAFYREHLDPNRPESQSEWAARDANFPKEAEWDYRKEHADLTAERAELDNDPNTRPEAYAEWRSRFDELSRKAELGGGHQFPEEPRVPSDLNDMIARIEKDRAFDEQVANAGKPRGNRNGQEPLPQRDRTSLHSETSVKGNTEPVVKKVGPDVTSVPDVDPRDALPRFDDIKSERDLYVQKMIDSGERMNASRFKSLTDDMMDSHLKPLDYTSGVKVDEAGQIVPNIKSAVYTTDAKLFSDALESAQADHPELKKWLGGLVDHVDGRIESSLNGSKKTTRGNWLKKLDGTFNKDLGRLGTEHKDIGIGADYILHRDQSRLADLAKRIALKNDHVVEHGIPLGTLIADALGTTIGGAVGAASAGLHGGAFGGVAGGAIAHGGVKAMKSLTKKLKELLPVYFQVSGRAGRGFNRFYAPTSLENLSRMNIQKAANKVFGGSKALLLADVATDHVNDLFGSQKPGNFFSEALKRTVHQLATSPADNASPLKDSYQDSIRSALASFGVKDAGDRSQTVDKVAAELDNQLSDYDDLHRHVNAIISDGAPNVAAAMSKKQLQNLQWIRSQLPTTTTGEFGQVSRPSKQQVESAMRKLAIYNDPSVVVRLIKDDRLHEDHVSALDTLYPRSAKKLRDSMASMSQSVSLPQGKRDRLLKLLSNQPSTIVSNGFDFQSLHASPTRQSRSTSNVDHSTEMQRLTNRAPGR